MSDLLRCPLCGNRAFVAHGNVPDVNGFPVWCLTDGCLRLPPRPSEAEAIAAWNRREQIQWTPGEPPKRDGEVVYGHTWQPYRWKAYSPKSEQFRRGIKGRWQAMNEYGGWDNAKAPDEWAAAEMIEKRKEALTNV